VTSSAAVRAAEPRDADAAGRICYEAFREIAERHGYPPDIPSPQFARELLAHLISEPGFYGVVAERDGRVVGSNFMDERSTIFGVGPIAIDLDAQNEGVGRLLMEAVLERARERGAAGVRLVQAAYHTRSLALYARLGFAVREQLLAVQGRPLAETVPGFHVRPGSEDDLEPCSAVCRAVHGHDRTPEVLDAARRGSLRVIERDGRAVGYTTGVGFFGHSVAATSDGVEALIADAHEFRGPGFLLPSRNAAVVRWALERRLRVAHVMTLMTIGLYSEPQGAWLPSVLY
jgi:predicted N-acetyltransferase YhbS